jgi:hypothetical protein
MKPVIVHPNFQQKNCKSIQKSRNDVISITLSVLYKILLTRYKQNIPQLFLKMRSDEQLRFIQPSPCFIMKSGSFNLKVPLFAENRKNKFAHHYKRNNFVFN